MTNTSAATIAVRAVKVSNLRHYVPGGYELLSGWTVVDAKGHAYSPDGERPWLPRGGRSAAMEVQASGLLPHAKFIPLAA